LKGRLWSVFHLEGRCVGLFLGLFKQHCSYKA
jgi:hypothetical protein